ncbi:MAG: transposase [bacterium]|nr:transposase [bacterium]
MLELADIVKEYGDISRKTYGDQMLPSHWDALWDIEQCRTAMMGGDLFWCDHCQESIYSYHSCGNRHCPKCGGDRADAWRDRQMAHLLPVPYFLVTFTLPHTLNPVARSNQKLVYDLLFKTSADALKTLALTPKWVGGKIGMVGALHTWDRSMGYHIHVHYLVPAGGLDPETGAWVPSHPKFLVPASALRDVFRAKFRDVLTSADPAVFAQVPPETWTKTWVVHCKPVGNGETALKYLTPYIARVALSNQRLVKMEDGMVTFRYKPHNGSWTTMTLDAMSFLHRFLQPVLPKGFQKIRYSGFLHPGARKTLAALQAQLAEIAPLPDQLPEALAATFGIEVTDVSTEDAPLPETPRCCPHCGGPLASLGRLPPRAETRAPP